MSYGTNQPATGRVLGGASSPYLTRPGRFAGEGLARVTVPAGRFLLSLIFLLSGVMKIVNWDFYTGYMASKGMEWIAFFLVLAAIFELSGGLSLLLGCFARLGAFLLLLFLIPTTLIFHGFWQYEGMEQQTQMIHFLKNLAVMGGLLVVMGFGAGPLSLDSRLARPEAAT